MRATDLLPLLAALLVTGKVRAQDAAGPEILLIKDGREVCRPQDHLAWQRCAVGTTWTGRACAGTPALLQHGAAVQAAHAQAESTGLPWRLPRARELQHLSQQLAAAGASGRRLFPQAPALPLWTSSTAVDMRRVNPYDYGNIARGVREDNVNRIAFLEALVVDMDGAIVGSLRKSAKTAVRLVRDEGC